MKLFKLSLTVLFLFYINYSTFSQSNVPFVLNEEGYFDTPGLNIIVFQDFYPDGHQGGVTIIQNGVRVLSNGDLRLDPTPGQWQPIPKMGERVVERDKNEISAILWFPDSSRNKKGFNPIIYPDLAFVYKVRVKPEGESIRISVDLEEPLPEEWYGKVGFNIELFPGFYFGKSYYMDDQFGIFPRQANGPIRYGEEKELLLDPLAKGKRLIVVPDNENEMIVIEAAGTDMELLDGRGEHNNGFFTVRTLVQKGKLKGAVEMIITPGYKKGWAYTPVIHVSQVGYHSGQSKVAVIELDKKDNGVLEALLYRISEKGGLEKIKTAIPETWGRFLRYNYLHFDFTEVKVPGMYKIKYGDVESVSFQISESIYDRHVWQPTLEYYLPVQMCHMRINDRYKVWHGLCHNDDALMAPTDWNHFDGYKQGPSTYTKFAPYESVPGINIGGWHDAGDYDLRVESQATTMRLLAEMYELFKVDYDETTIDQGKKLVEMHRPDGKPDVLQQIEHGALTIVSGYEALGRLYRGIIVSEKRQYTHLGDGATMTDNLFFDSSLYPDGRTATSSAIMDDRWVFTEQNPRREISVAACLATSYRSLKGFNDTLANDCIEIAKALWEEHAESGQMGMIDASVELFLSTDDKKYSDYIIKSQEQVVKSIGRVGPSIAKVYPVIEDKKFKKAVKSALEDYAQQVDKAVGETPFGVQYKPNVWGAGWGIQRFGVDQYFLHRGFPDIFDADPMFNALNFILGVHPGSNSASFVSGVGVESILVAYGVNRDEWSYIPGGSVSGTALIRPDFPELKEWPYFWQQTEYVMGGGATRFMFMVLAAQDLLK